MSLERRCVAGGAVCDVHDVEEDFVHFVCEVIERCAGSRAFVCCLLSLKQWWWKVAFIAGKKKVVLEGLGIGGLDLLPGLGDG